MIPNLKYTLAVLMTMLLGCTVAVGVVALWGDRQGMQFLCTIERSTKELASRVDPLRSTLDDVSERISQMSNMADSLDGRFSEVVHLVEKAEAMQDATTSESMRALAGTGFQLLDRHLDRLKLLVDALTKSTEIREAARNFQLASLVDLKLGPPMESPMTERMREHQSVVADTIEALVASANADTYVVIGLDGEGRGKGIYSNHEHLFGAELSDSCLFREVIQENRITKGIDRIGDDLLIGAASILHDSTGSPIAVIICGSKLDLASLRFLARDLHAELALFDSQFHKNLCECRYSTFVDKQGTSTPFDLPPGLKGKFEACQLSLRNETTLSRALGQQSIRNEFVEFESLDVGGRAYSTSFQPLIANDGTILGLLAVGRDIQALNDHRRQVSIQSTMARDQVASLRIQRKEVERVSQLQAQHIWEVNEASRRAEADLQQFVVKANHDAQFSRGLVWASLAVALAVFGIILFFAHNRVLSPLANAIQAIMESKMAIEQQAKELEHAKTLAEDASRSKSAFLANMSHEIRTPMTAILGFADLLTEESEHALSAKQLEYIGTIKKSGHHLSSIIDDILDISKIEAGKLSIEIMDTSIDQLLQDVMRLTNHRVRDKGLDMHICYATPIPRVIQSDPVRLQQIIVNLVGNAIKFTEKGSVTIVISVPRPHRLRIAIMDTGIGLKPEQLDRLFQAFEQADSSITRRFGGSGLGLCISRELSGMLGGDLEVESVFGEGSQFTIEIQAPASEDEELLTEFTACDKEAHYSATSDDTALEIDQLNPLENLRILLAEDGLDNQRLISFHLQKAGAQLTIVDNGKKAVELLTRDNDMNSPLKPSLPFDLLLLDMQMPELDGYSTARYLREKGAKLPIVALTAHAMTSDAQKCINAGCDSYLTKPIDKHLLIKTCQEQVAKHRSKANSKGETLSLDSHAMHAAIEPIYSQFADDEEMSTLIELFLESLGTLVVSIEADFQKGDFEHLGRLAHQLKGAGGGYGFPSLSQAAARVEVRINAEMDAIGLKGSVEELLAICRGLLAGSAHAANSVASHASTERS